MSVEACACWLHGTRFPHQQCLAGLQITRGRKCWSLTGRAILSASIWDSQLSSFGDCSCIVLEECAKSFYFTYFDIVCVNISRDISYIHPFNFVRCCKSFTFFDFCISSQDLPERGRCCVEFYLRVERSSGTTWGTRSISSHRTKMPQVSWCIYVLNEQ